MTKVYNHFLRICGVTIAPKASIDYRCEIVKKNNIHIGARSILYKCTTIYKKREGGFSMGIDSHIAPYGYFLIDKQRITIGNQVAIGPFCSFFCYSNAIPKDKKTFFKDTYIAGDITVGNNVFIGAQCVIMPGTIIGDNVVIASNSTIKGTLESGYLYGGNPAKVIKDLDV